MNCWLLPLHFCRIASAVGRGALSFSTSDDIGRTYGSETFVRLELGSLNGIQKMFGWQAK